MERMKGTISPYMHVDHRVGNTKLERKLGESLRAWVEDVKTCWASALHGNGRIWTTTRYMIGALRSHGRGRWCVPSLGWRVAVFELCVMAGQCRWLVIGDWEDVGVMRGCRMFWEMRVRSWMAVCRDAKKMRWGSYLGSVRGCANCGNVYKMKRERNQEIRTNKKEKD